MNLRLTAPFYGTLRRGIDDGHGPFRWLLALFLLALSLGLAGCGADGGASNEEGDGEVVISLTDAEGDFASYTVDVLSLTLTKANGTVVETLPVSTRVDFAQYTDLTEFLTAATVPNGVYVAADMVLDYRNADIRVENAAGDSVKVDSILDTDGNPVTQLDMSVDLEGRNSLRVAPGLPSHMTLDFDLKASNNVAFDTGTPTMIVKPMLLADLELERPKVHRLRGPLADVDLRAQTFEVILRPFHHAMDNDRRRHFGALKVVSNDATLYDISGETYEGQAGLEALDTLPAFTAVVVLGDLKMNPRRFEAREVYAGTSVPGGDLDVITGNVIARRGDVLTVKGATLVRAGGSVIFNDQVIVNLGEMTTVKRQMSMGNTWTIDDVSVGQRVRIFGSLITDTATRLEMDAGVNVEGRVQMRFTTLRGAVVGRVSVAVISPQPLPFVIKLRAIDGRGVGLFDFSGTGNGTDNDANPSNYEIDTAMLDTSSFTDGMPVRVRGFVRAFGQAPADFEAKNLVDVVQQRAVMAVNWIPPTGRAIETVSADGITLNLAGVGRFHYLVRGRVSLDLTEQDTAPQIVPRTEGPRAGEGMFWIGEKGTRQLHTTFANFARDLDARLAAGAQVKYVGGRGYYDDRSGVLTAGFVAIALK
ncbi:MAG: DUF4382 domain-containing protein [Gammaproteobacteria bacterium]|nr:DUF4382 domain-containing protein [Gammaproteobacteria bacterium]